MGRKIIVNWKQLNNLSVDTTKNAEEFENIRSSIEDIMKSIESCWQGADSQEFIKQTTNYLESLKEDTAYLYSTADYFNRSAKRYNYGVDSGLTSVRNLEQNYIKQENNRFENIGGNMYE